MRDDSGGQRCVPSLHKETDFLGIIPFSEPQPRVGSARPLGEAAKLIRAAGKFPENKLENRRDLTSACGHPGTFDPRFFQTESQLFRFADV